MGRKRRIFGQGHRRKRHGATAADRPRAFNRVAAGGGQLPLPLLAGHAEAQAGRSRARDLIRRHVPLGLKRTEAAIGKLGTAPPHGSIEEQLRLPQVVLTAKLAPGRQRALQHRQGDQ